jgi:hypothetical protein
VVDVATPQGQRIESRKDLGPLNDESAIWTYWSTQEAIAQKEEKKWIDRADAIVKRYRDERPDAQGGGQVSKFNILWSNVQTLIPTLYGRTPKPDVDRRFKDQDPVGRYASMLLERCISYSLDECDFDDVMEACVEDRLLPGRGVPRVLYIPHFGEVIPDEKTQAGTAESPDKEAGEGKFGEEEDKGTDETNIEFQQAQSSEATIAGAGDAEEDGKPVQSEDEGEPLREVVYEEVVCVYVYWKDYLEGPGRKDREVPWKRYRSFMTREELVKRFGKKKGRAVNLDQTNMDRVASGMSDASKPDPMRDIYQKAAIHETWDKTKKETIWWAPGTPDVILDTKQDPLRLPNFYPSPPCLRSTTTNDKLVPVPDYVEYQDQARELDKITARIDKLTEALQVKGIYPGENKQELQQLFDVGTDNRLIPVADWSAITDKGGLKEMIHWVPIEQIAQTLIQLYDARDRTKALLYELTGIGDIMRGMTNPDETAQAQTLKANFSTRRVTPQQKKVAKLARNVIRLMGAVIAEHFSGKTISLITGFPVLAPVPQLPPQPQMPLAALMGHNDGPPMGMPGAPQPTSPGPPPRPPGAMNGQPIPPPAGAGPGGPAVPGQGAATAGPPGDPGQPPQAPPPNPALVAYQQQLAQWQQLKQQVDAITAGNQQKQQEFDAAVALIKSDGAHGFKIDIEADSTIAPDEQAEQAGRTDLIAKLVPLLEQVIPLAQGQPALADLAKELVLFALRGFKVGRPLEEVVEKAFVAVSKMPPPPPKGGAGSGADTPAALALRKHEVDSRVQIDQGDQQIEAQKVKQGDAKLALERQKLGMEAAETVMEHQARESEGQAKHAMEQAHLGLEQRKADDALTIHRAREESIASRSAGRLT